jgi:hypothetical protein
MSTSSAEPCDRLRQAIDDEINSWAESTRALRSRRNALAPISRVPPETLAAIFSFLSPSWNKEAGHLAWMHVAHVCRRWRETALNHPHLWSYINFAKLTPAGVAGILARAKMAPLHLEADVTQWSVAQFDVFEKHLEAHMSHIHHLSICGCLQAALDRLVSSAPALEFLSLSHKPRQYALAQVIIPVNLFDRTTPSLTSLELKSCNISWKSPLLKGLRTLEILRPSKEARPKLEDWLGALNEMPQLETLILQYATPPAPRAAPFILEPSRAVTLPSITRFHIIDSARDCALALAHLVLPALAHLVLPALIWLNVDAKSRDSVEDIHLVIPYVARKVHGLQGTEPLRSILMTGERTRAEVVAWTTPDADVKVCDLDTLLSASVSARLMFAATGINWQSGADTTIFDSLITLLPMDSVSTLTAQNRARPSKEFWLRNASMWPLLERVRMVPTSIKAFGDMLVEEAPPDGPRLPSLTKLTLVRVKLTALRTYHLRDILIERVEQGVPLEVLDLRTCFAADHAIQLLKEVVVEVQGPLAPPPMPTEEPSFFNWNGGVGCSSEVEYDDGWGPWYGCYYGDMDGDGDEEYDDELARDNDGFYTYGTGYEGGIGYDAFNVDVFY